MSDYTKHRAIAAQWMLENDKPNKKYWRWHVLTAKNPNSNPGLEEGQASLIFGDLIQSGLLIPVIAEDGQGAHVINMGRIKEWNMLANPWRWWLRRNLLLLLAWLLGSIASALVGFCVGLWWNKIPGL